MGGLVARYYLEVLDGWADGSVRALITLGTPFRGSLNALHSLANGISVGPIPINSLTDICRSFTSVYQLLPIFPAYDTGNGKLERVGEVSGIPHVDANHAHAALAFHKELHEAVNRNRTDPLWEKHGYGLYPIVGRGQRTSYIGRLAGSTIEMSDLYNGQFLGGDGTVPRVSAIPLEFDDLKRRGDMYSTTKHGSLQNARPVLEHIVGRVNDLYTQFGGFRGIPSAGDDLALEVDDVVPATEPVVVRVRPQSPRALTFTLFASRDGASINEITLLARDEEWVTCRFDPLPAGTYRVIVRGTGAEPVEEAFAVADINDALTKE
jgi:hypothetical protein